MVRERPSLEGIDVEGLTRRLSTADLEYAILFGSRVTGNVSTRSDVDLCIRFPSDCSDRERFQRRNRIDADVQRFADTFVDVSDFESLPVEIAYNALRDGRLLCGDDTVVAADRRRIEERLSADRERRERDRRAFIERLAGGDD